MHEIFLSYRHTDIHVAQHIADLLKKEFGSYSTFIDNGRNLHAGSSLTPSLEKALGRCKVLLVIVSKDWVADLKHRQGFPGRVDFVAAEIEYALQYQKSVIPLLIDGATMPHLEDLPQATRPFADTVAQDYRSGEHLPYYLNKLCEVITRTIKPEATITVEFAMAGGEARGVNYRPQTQGGGNLKVLKFTGYSETFKVPVGDWTCWAVIYYTSITKIGPSTISSSESSTSECIHSSLKLQRYRLVVTAKSQNILQKLFTRGFEMNIRLEDLKKAEALQE